MPELPVAGVRCSRDRVHLVGMGKQVPAMSRIKATRWFRLRLAFAIGVLILLAVELTGHRSWIVVALQALLIIGIIITSALDLRDVHGRRAAGPGTTSA